MASRAPSINLRHIRRRQLRYPFNGVNCWYSSVGQESQRPRWQTGANAQRTRRLWDVRRDGSTLASSTGFVNTKAVPSHVQALYDALTAIKRCAGAYVDLGRLQLALRSLETPDPVVRVAVLGISGQVLSCRLLRLLLADPLSAPSSWEQYLDDVQVQGQKGLLVRYGEHPRVIAETPLHTTLLVPSSMLKANNLEIIVLPINQRMFDVDSVKQQITTEDLLLAPLLEAAVPSGSRYTAITYPVHKAIILCDGVRDCLIVGRFILSTTLQRPPETIKVVVDLAARLGPPEPDARDPTITVDTELASSALNRFRKSMQDATVYERDWLRSDVSTVSTWLKRGLDARNVSLKPVVGQLIRSVLEGAERKIAEEDMAKSKAIQDVAVSGETRRRLNSALRSWAERAHTELREQLDIAFHDREWKRLRWWKLVWRIDDVILVASSILQHRWLVQAERRMIWLNGLLEGTGLSNGPPTGDEFIAACRAEEDDLASLSVLGSPPATLESSVSTRLKDQAKDSMHRSCNAPWSLGIALARSRLSTATILPLQALGQNLLIRSLSVSALSSALSAFMYASSSGSSVYEAGAVAAIGIAWSARTLQRGWETARTTWDITVREEGRRVLRETEERLSTVIREGGRPAEDQETMAARQRARQSVTSARNALEQLSKRS